MLNVYEFQKLNQAQQQAYISKVANVQLEISKRCIVARFESGFNKTFVTTNIIEVIKNLEEVFKKQILRETTMEEDLQHDLEEAKKLRNYIYIA